MPKKTAVTPSAELASDAADPSAAIPASSLRRFTIRGGGAHPELALDHPGLFLGPDAALEVEEIASGRWRIVTNAQDAMVEDAMVEDATEATPTEATPTEATPTEATPVADAPAAGALVASPSAATDAPESAPDGQEPPDSPAPSAE